MSSGSWSNGIAMKDSRDSSLSAKWLLGIAITIICMMTATAVGWLKSAIDVQDDRLRVVEQMVEDVKGKQDMLLWRLTQAESAIQGVQNHQGQLLQDTRECQDQYVGLKQELSADEAEEERLEGTVQNHSDWISATVDSSKAVRVLRGRK